MASPAAENTFNVNVANSIIIRNMIILEYTNNHCYMIAPFAIPPGIRPVHSAIFVFGKLHG